jgi:chitin disaccharide deacetylase
MLIINADDWGRSRADTDAALACHRAGRITSASAMVFMEDSERAADLAKGCNVDIGLHVNFTKQFTTNNAPAKLREKQDRIAGFLTRSKYALLVYNPLLRQQFRDVFHAQLEEFVRIYGTRPSHFDGHQHMHLCTNMLVDAVIPAGEKIRRSFSFWPGEKSIVNRTYRSFIDGWLARRYHLPDFLFSLCYCLKTGRVSRALECARIANVELMTHPIVVHEYAFLMSENYFEMMQGLEKGSYPLL